MQPFDFIPGTAPLLVSMPHSGLQVPAELSARMTEAALALPDTDWHLDRLYDFATDHGASVLLAKHSRYVVDLNRPPSDESLYENQVATGLCPRQTFAGQEIYRDGEVVGDDEQKGRIAAYWQPYHGKISATLQQIRERFGYALLWDAHSIPGEVPLLFEGVLPDLNIGTNGGLSCAANFTAAVATVAEDSPYSSVVNGRFRGGHITRNYGAPARGIHAIQLELTQRNYMDEKILEFDSGRAVRLVDTIKKMLQTFESAADEGN